ncbi:MAG TPA: hypothetical protein VGQ55_14430 [Pyrinomonadaceae bacterium]|jgi:hypothetical protein|nr:hypothetical protein [Pyrinomonadaceae bacterium]
MKMISIAALTLCTVLFLSDCASDPRKAKATQIFSEINEIAQKPVEKEPMMNAMVRLNEAKKNFPAERDKIFADVQLGKEFCNKAIEYNTQLIDKYEELLSLGIDNPSADCVQSSLKVQHALIEQMRLSISEFDILLDEDITDKATLDSKSLPIRESAKLAAKSYEDLNAEQRSLCSKSSLNIK